MSGSHNWSNKAWCSQRSAQWQVHTVFYLADSCYLECRTTATHSSDGLPWTQCLPGISMGVTKKKETGSNRADRLFLLALSDSEVRLWCLPVCRGLAGAARPAASTQCSHLESLIKHGNLIYSNTALISTYQFSTWTTSLTFIITWLIECPVVDCTAQPHTSEAPPARWPRCSDTQSAHFNQRQAPRLIWNSDRMRRWEESACRRPTELRRLILKPWDTFTISSIWSLPGSFENLKSKYSDIWRNVSNDCS